MDNQTTTPKPKPAVTRRIKDEARRVARDEARKVARRRTKADARRKIGYSPFRQGSSLKTSKRQLHISEYLASLISPETMNVPAPALGPFPTREFSLVSVFEIKLNTAAAVTDAVAFDVEPAQLQPINFSNNAGEGLLSMYYGNCFSQGSPPTLLGTGAANVTSGPSWMSELRSRASNAFLNSASLKVDYIGGTFKDAGLLTYATLPVYDDGSTATAPPYDSSLATWPLSGSVPTPQGIHLFWLPGEYGVPERTIITNYSRHDGILYAGATKISGVTGQGVSSFWRIFATTGVGDGESVFRVTVTQNFSFITADKLFAASPNCCGGWSSPMQRTVEHRALAQAVNTGSNSLVGVPVARQTDEGRSVPDEKFQKKRTNALVKFLKREWSNAAPQVGKFLWNNRAKIGNYISDLVSPAGLPDLPPSTVVIEEVGEEAAEALPLLAL
jgi:hypothetical protein